MKADDPRAKWHPVDEAAAHSLVMSTSAPGMVYPLDAAALPSQIMQMPQVISYFVSNYAQPIPLANGATAGGQLAVVRVHGETAKAYNYIFATSTDGRVVFNGPHFNFPGHHFASTAPLPVESLFYPVPVTGKG
jgi:hypothetical protein